MRRSIAARCSSRVAGTRSSSGSGGLGTRAAGAPEADDEGLAEVDVEELARGAEAAAAVALAVASDPDACRSVLHPVTARPTPTVAYSVRARPVNRGRSRRWGVRGTS
jgi:hypothetical protein